MFCDRKQLKIVVPTVLPSIAIFNLIERQCLQSALLHIPHTSLLSPAFSPRVTPARDPHPVAAAPPESAQ